jgi:hypothetical protein
VTDSNQAILAAQAAVQGLVDVVGERDAALAAASANMALAADALADMRAQNDALRQSIANLQVANDALQAQVSALQSQVDQLTTPTGYTPIKADKTGSVDASAAIQAAIDQGGKQYLPAGRYLVDPTRVSVSTTRQETTAIQLRNGTDLLLHADAVLVSKPHNRARAYVLWGKGLTNVLVQGGQLLGERLQHTMSGTGTDEWVHGVSLQQCQATVRDLRATRFTGDAFSVSGDITLERVKGLECRRQGLSIGAGKVSTKDCEFCNTGDLTVDGVVNRGTSPMSGIDIEPDAGVAAGVKIEGGKVADNSRVGIQLYTRSGTGASIKGVEIRGVEIKGNTNGIEAGAAAGPVTDVLVAGCNVHDNKYAGSKWGANTAATIGGPNGDANTFKGNGYKPVQALAGSTVKVLENITG